MSTSLIMIKRPRMLIAVEPLVIEVMEGIPNEQEVRAIVTVPRNIKMHRLLFALLNVVIRGQAEPPMFPTTDKLLDALKMATGLTREFIDIQGNLHIVPDSISFGKMDQVAFKEWFEAAIKMILERVLPNCNRADLEQQVYDMLREPGPDQLESRR